VLGDEATRLQRLAEANAARVAAQIRAAAEQARNEREFQTGATEVLAEFAADAGVGFERLSSMTKVFGRFS
jgi:hypothetical protein